MGSCNSKINQDDITNKEDITNKQKEPTSTVIISDYTNNNNIFLLNDIIHSIVDMKVLSKNK